MKKILFHTFHIGAFVWSVCVFSLFSLLLVVSDFGSDKEALSSPENPVILGLFGNILFYAGILSFTVTTAAWILTCIYKPEKKYKPILGISATKSIIAVVTLFFLMGIFAYGYMKGQEALLGTGNFTGEEMFNAVNNYRLENGKNELILEETICDNLVQRFLDVSNPDNAYKGHNQFEEWVTKEGLNQHYKPIAELYIKNVHSTDDAIDFWQGSPGHRLSLEGDYDAGCAYAERGTGVVVLGERIGQ